MTAPLPPVISSKATEEFPRCCNIRDRKLKKIRIMMEKKNPRRKIKETKQNQA